MGEVPKWKRAALASLPWTLEAGVAAQLILSMPDEMGSDWPSRDPRIIAGAALEEARERIVIILSASTK